MTPTQKHILNCPRNSAKRTDSLVYTWQLKSGNMNHTPVVEFDLSYLTRRSIARMKPSLQWPAKIENKKFCYDICESISIIPYSFGNLMIVKNLISISFFNFTIYAQDTNGYCLTLSFATDGKSAWLVTRKHGVNCIILLCLSSSVLLFCWLSTVQPRFFVSALTTMKIATIARCCVEASTKNKTKQKTTLDFNFFKKKNNN